MLEEEFYWFPESLGDSILFLDQDSNKIQYQIVEKIAWHTDKYISDTGCRCTDISRVFAVNKQDTMWFSKRHDYTENWERDKEDRLGFIYNGGNSYFNSSKVTAIDTIQINGIIIEDVLKYSEVRVDTLPFKSVYLARNLGVVKIDLKDGGFWVNQKLEISDTTKIADFSYMESSCN